MIPVEPPAYDGTMGVVYAKDQPQYIPLPARVDSTGMVITEWEPTAEDLERLLQGGRVRLCIHTHMQPLQPVSLDVIEPECGMRRA